MRHLLIFLLIFSLLAVSWPIWAQDTKQDDASIYTVTDVASDVSADSAAHARDQAISQAQRTAFNQLLDRLGAPAMVAKKLSDDDIATLVKNFEVQNERTSAVRYIGTFTVQFKSGAVRNYLGNHNATFSEAKSNPVVVLPVLVTGSQNILWEDKTKWRTAWENSASASGLVPVTIPAGGLDDIALLSTAEAIQGKSPAIRAIIDKYQAHGAVVAILTADLDKPGAPFKVDVAHYNTDGDASETTQVTLPSATTKAGINDALTQAVQQVRRQLEKDWKKEAQEAPAEAIEDGVSVSSSLSRAISAPQEPTSHLPMVVMINSLPDWTQIERKLESIQQIVRVDVIMLQRGSTNIEVEFRGSIDGLQFALNQQGLFLKQDNINKTWLLRPMQIGGN